MAICYFFLSALPNSVFIVLPNSVIIVYIYIYIYIYIYLFIYLRKLKWFSMFTYCDINTRDVARLENNTNKYTSRRQVFFSLSKFEQHPKCAYHSI